ncbi:MAG: YbfB/YjiJ family MFS transporter, partial [Pseudomonadota bacterium]|nr:YbfB/YjiJ family MFS transporter [Pseudomonadota bacterium]
MRQTWPSIVAGICALTLSMGIGRFAYTPIIAIMEQQAGLSVLTAGWVASANYLGYF